MAWERYVITFDVASFLCAYSEQNSVPELQFDFEIEENAMRPAIAIQFQTLPFSCDKKLVDQVLTIIVQDEEIFKKTYPLFIQWLNENKGMDRARRSTDERFLQMLDLGLIFVVSLLLFLGVIFIVPIHLPLLFAVGGTVTGLLFLGLIITATRWVKAYLDLKLHRNQVEELGRELIANTLTNAVPSACGSSQAISSVDLESTDPDWIQTQASFNSTIERTSKLAGQSDFFQSNRRPIILRIVHLRHALNRSRSYTYLT